MDRFYYLDWLRVFATVCVVIIHVAAGYVGNMNSNYETHWLIGNLFETLSRWSVPGFVMVSGALLLRDSRELGYWEFLKKRASKVIIPFLGWSILFYLFGAYMGYFPSTIKHAIKLFISNEISYHFWFLYMIIGIYLITPLFQVFVRHAKKQHIEYFLVLWLYVSFATRLMEFWFGIHLSLELFFVKDYVGYFLLGYYLSQFEIARKWRIASYIGMLVGFVGTFACTYYFTISADGQFNDFWYSYFSPTVLLSVIGLFIWFRYNVKERTLPLLAQWINQASLGIYIIHYWLLNNLLWRVFPKVESYFHPILSISINIGITFILSLTIILLIKRIPIVKKLVP